MNSRGFPWGWLPVFLLLSALRHFAQGFRVSPCLAYSMVLFSTFWSPTFGFV